MMMTMLFYSTDKVGKETRLSTWRFMAFFLSWKIVSVLFSCSFSVVFYKESFLFRSLSPSWVAEAQKAEEPKDGGTGGTMATREEEEEKEDVGGKRMWGEQEKRMWVEEGMVN